MGAWQLDWALVGLASLKLFVAVILALPTAWERARSTGTLALRTFPIVALASCAYVLVSTATIGYAPDAQSRVLQGLMTGMGFIGGGAILKERGSVRGTTTAASLWMTSAIGAAVGYGHAEIAVLASIFTALTLFTLTPTWHGRRRPRPPGNTGD